MNKKYETDEEMWSRLDAEIERLANIRDHNKTLTDDTQRPLWKPWEIERDKKIAQQLAKQGNGHKNPPEVRKPYKSLKMAGFKSRPNPK